MEKAISFPNVSCRLTREEHSTGRGWPPLSRSNFSCMSLSKRWHSSARPEPPKAHMSPPERNGGLLIQDDCCIKLLQ